VPCLAPALCRPFFSDGRLLPPLRPLALDALLPFAGPRLAMPGRYGTLGPEAHGGVDDRAKHEAHQDRHEDQVEAHR
jgi:hypothetical protein